ncbi:hypothetical protein VST7929_01791 [Vibrio stylophorae]|uniref:Primosomal protein n=1 Tax=Vibrio stylophorae TaxID=659351 RepID=A0ABN8DUG1_9VIBR|nr:hypothetical protein VST7929_01791 [Vibrio stylophorae]
MTTPPLNQAPAHIQLAVDLIYLLESNDIDPQTALKALAIVQQDLEQRLDKEPTCPDSN